MLLQWAFHFFSRCKTTQCLESSRQSLLSFWDELCLDGTVKYMHISRFGGTGREKNWVRNIFELLLCIHKRWCSAAEYYGWHLTMVGSGITWGLWTGFPKSSTIYTLSMLHMVIHFRRMSQNEMWADFHAQKIVKFATQLWVILWLKNQGHGLNNLYV